MRDGRDEASECVAAGGVMSAACEAQEARAAAEREAGALRGEVEGVLARHRERVAAWEADAAADEASLQQRAAALEARPPLPFLMPPAASWPSCMKF